MSDPYARPPQPPPRRGPYPRPPQAPGRPPYRAGPPPVRQPAPDERPTEVLRPIVQPTRQYEQPPPPPPVPYQPEPAPERYRPADHEPSESPVDYQRERDRRHDRTNLIANTIHVVTALIAFDFVLHIVFTLFGANQNSGFVGFVYGVAKVFVLGFGDVFTPGSATIGLIANYGLAAIVYLVVGRILYRTLRR
jgi:hypothetical protein